MNRAKGGNDQAYKLLIRALKKVDVWKEYEQVVCDAFNSMCGLTKRLEIVKAGENDMDEVSSKYAIGVLSSFPGCVHSLSKRISDDIENNWKIISQQLTSMNALVVHELQVIEDEAYKLFPSIPVGSIAIQGSGTPITVAECVLWINQINKMITAEYLRKRDLFTLYTTNQIDNFTEASTSWAASSPEGMIQYELCSRISFHSFVVAEISERVSLVNQCICLLNIIMYMLLWLLFYCSKGIRWIRPFKNH